MRGCTGDGTLDDSQYTKPLPVIGLYIAGASLLCAIALVSDVIGGFRRRKPWLPAIYFPLNATSLTILGVATKLSVDLNSSMPRHVEQLSKLSSTAFLCTFMANVLPSLGSMDGSEVLSNVVALVILVITAIVNMCIQMGTGVIYVFLPEHAVILLLVMALLVVTCSTALAVPAARRQLNQQYERKHKSFPKDQEWLDKERIVMLYDRVKSYWLMARTSNPQHVIGRSPACSACGVFCLLSALVLLEAIVRSSFISKPMFCSGSSDYGWSILYVVVAQAIAVLMGTVGVMCRWLYVARVCRDIGVGWNDRFRVEEYWVQMMSTWKEQTEKEYWVHALSSSSFQNHVGGWRKVIRKLVPKSILGIVIVMKLQTGVVIVSKFVWLISVLPVAWLKKKLMSSVTSNININSIDATPAKTDFVLHLQGETDYVKTEFLQRGWRMDIEQFIQRGRDRRRPGYLIELVKRQSNPARGFERVAGFDSSVVPVITAREIPNCWSLPVVVLASIAVALPNISQESISSLLKGVDEGLQYIRLIEKNLDGRRESVYSREAADAVWVGIVSGRKWFKEDLPSLAKQSTGSEEDPIQELARIGKEGVRELGVYRGERIGYPNEQHVEELAANCMYRISETILVKYAKICRTDGYLFPWIQKAISDIMAACLTNLPRAMEMECSPKPIAVQEEIVENVVSLLWGAEEILQRLCIPDHPYPKNREYLDDWIRERRSLKE